MSFPYTLKTPGGTHLAGFIDLKDAEMLAVAKSLKAPTATLSITGPDGIVHYRNGERLPEEGG